jgi:hypothetical protein
MKQFVMNLCALVLVGCNAFQPIDTTNTTASTSLNFETNRIASETASIRSDAETILKENKESSVVNAHANQILDSATRIEAETVNLQNTTALVVSMEKQVAELTNAENITRQNSLETLYKYITLFWVIGFVVLAGGAVIAFMVNKTMGFSICVVGAIMLGFASASQYYLEEIAMGGGALLILMVVTGIGMVGWSLFKSKNNATAIREIVEMMEILKEDMTDSERSRIFGADGLATKVQSDLTKEIIQRIRDKNGFTRLAEVRAIAAGTTGGTPQL